MAADKTKPKQEHSHARLGLYTGVMIVLVIVMGLLIWRQMSAMNTTTTTTPESETMTEEEIMENREMAFIQSVESKLATAFSNAQTTDLESISVQMIFASSEYTVGKVTKTDAEGDETVQYIFAQRMGDAFEPLSIQDTDKLSCEYEELFSQFPSIYTANCSPASPAESPETPSVAPEQVVE